MPTSTFNATQEHEREDLQYRLKQVISHARNYLNDQSRARIGKACSLAKERDLKHAKYDLKKEHEFYDQTVRDLLDLVPILQRVEGQDSAKVSAPKVEPQKSML